MYVQSNENEITKAILALNCLRKTPVAHRIEALNNIVNILNTTNNSALRPLKNENLLTYYAILAELTHNKLEQPIQLPGPTGEENLLFTQGKGIILCLVSDTDTLSQLAIQLGAILAAGCPALIVTNDNIHTQISSFIDTLSIHPLPDNTIQVVNLQAQLPREHVVNIYIYLYMEIQYIL